jgi:hypothetical protein
MVLLPLEFMSMNNKPLRTVAKYKDDKEHTGHWVHNHYI